MKALKTLAVAIVAAIALLGGAGLRPATPANATPVQVLAINPDICTVILVGAGQPTGAAANICQQLVGPTGLQFHANLLAIDHLVGNDDGIIEPSDFASMSLGANQMHDTDGQLWIVAFVSQSYPVLFLTDRGQWTVGGTNVGQTYECNTFAQDPDCDLDPTQPEDDRVVVEMLSPGGYGRGTGHVGVVQQNVQFPIDITIVGEPFSLSFQTLENTIEAGAASCPLPVNTQGFLDALGAPEKSVVIGVAKDTDGTAVAGAFISWGPEFTGTTPQGGMAAPLTPTLDLGSFGIGAPNAVCGGSASGTLSVNASIINQPPIETASHVDTATIDFTVAGRPANLTLAAAPATLVCDGVNTSTVTATVTDAAGNPAVAGVPVHFETVALGTASPIIGKVAGGTASSTITPLSGAVSGVTVNVFAGFNAGPTTAPVFTPTVSGSIVIACQPGAPAAPAGPGGAAPGGGGITGEIRPPSTGQGPAEGTAFPVWPGLAAAAAGSVLLAAGLRLRGARA